MAFSISDDLEYKVLPIVFYYFTASGVWLPSDWGPFSKLLYRFFSTYMGTMGFLFWLAVIVNAVLKNTKSEHFFENIFAVTVLTYSLYKLIFVSKKRKTIEKWIKWHFKNNWFEPRNQDEARIVESYKSETRWASGIYCAGIMLALLTKNIKPLLKSGEEWVLVVEIWYPYDINVTKHFLTAYIFESLGGVPLIWLHISFDTLFVALILELCKKIKILKHRLKNLNNSFSNEDYTMNYQSEISSQLATYTEKHAYILSLAKETNFELQGIMTGQIFASLPNICIQVYVLAVHKGGINFEFIDVICTFIACLAQIFLYCWYGNKIILQSMDVSNAVYEINWLSMNATLRKRLLTMMVRTTRPIKFAVGSFVMNIDSFIGISRMSFSAARLLQQIS